MGRLASLCAALALLAVPAAAAAGPLETGMVMPAPGIYSSSDEDLVLSRIRAAGATFVRVPLSWAAVASRRPADSRSPADPAYDWRAFDALLDAVHAHGLEPLVSVEGAPAWAQDTSEPLDFTPPDPSLAGAIRPSPDEYGAFARAAAERYDGSAGHPRVRYWRAWNEPNLSVYLLPQFAGADPVSPDWYRSMLNSFAGAIHAVSADNVVVAGGLAPFGARTSTAEVVSPLRFMRRLLCMSSGPTYRPTCGARAHFDVWAVHPYTSGGPTRKAANPDDVSLGDLPRVRALLTAAKRAGRLVSKAPAQLWVTEFSWDTQPPDEGAHVVPIYLHARWVAEALYRLWGDGVTHVTWLELRDDPYPSAAAQSGLYFRGGESPARDAPKPALVAFRFPFVAYRASRVASVWGRTPSGSAALVNVERRTGGTWRVLATLRADRHGIFSGRVRLAPARRAAARPRSFLAAYRKVVLGDSPEFFWRLGEAGGGVARDDTGRRDAVYLGRFRSVPGALGANDGAVELNGAARVELGPIAAPATVELWLRTRTGSPTAAFSNRGARSDGTYVGLEDSVHALAFQGAALGGRAWVTDGRWHHIVYTNAAGLGRLYVDGRLDDAGPVVPAQGGDAVLGYDSTLRRYLKGSIDEVAVYDYPLSAAQVRAHFLASGRPPSYADEFDVMQPGQTYLRARLANGSATSLPFSLTRPPDRFVLPFGI